MKAAAVLGKKDIRIVDVAEPKVEDDGVLIEVKACGICGTDMHVYNSNLLLEDSTKMIDGYRIIGHEFVGEIIEVGTKVKEFKVGDSVASVHNKGGMAEYVEVHGERVENLFKIPENISLETAATLEPLCNPTHSFHLREPKDDETIAIFGAGIIGLGYLQIVNAYSNAKTIVTDIAKLRVEMAEKLGADMTINAKKEDPVKKIKELTGDHYVRYQKKTAGGCDVSIDCAGIPLTFQQSLEVVKPIEGTVVVAGIYMDEVKIDPNMIVHKYLSILGSMGYYPSETEEALSLIANGKVNRDMLITHKYSLDDAGDAFQMQGDPDKSIKVLVTN